MITITGVATLSNDIKKQEVYFDLDFNNETYHWATRTPLLSSGSLLNYLNDSVAFYEADISAKEAIWAVCPKEKEIEMPGGIVITVPVLKEEIVFPILETDEDKFDSNIALQRMAEVFTIERIAVLAGPYGVIRDFMVFKNFSGIKLFINYLKDQSIATTEDYNNFIAILLEQNIDLSNY